MFKIGLQQVILLALVLLLFSSIPSMANSGRDAGGSYITVTGELSVVYHDDFKNHTAELAYVVKDAATKKHHKLRFKNKAPSNLKSGMIVTVSGTEQEGEIFLALDETGGGTIQTTTSTLQTTTALTGEQKTLVLVGNFQDVNVTCSNPAIGDLMFNDPLNKSVDDLYKETSYGNVWFTGQVVGPYLINYTSAGTCDYNAWGNAIDAAAIAAGVDLSAYPRKVYVMPPNSCPASGIGNVGGSTTRAWIFHCDVPDVFAHELGHNLGMYHAATPSSEYGDTTDIMGLAVNKLRQINAPHKEQVGWVPDSRVQTINQSGLYDVAPLQLDPSNAQAPQAIKLVKTDTNEQYYLSYRLGIGFDANLSTTSQLDRLSVHRWSGAGKTYLLAMLADGESFVDAVNGITVKQVGHTSDYSTVQVDMTIAPCSHTTPQISATPTSQNGFPGNSLNYTVTVTNTDSASCGSSMFSLQGGVPSGWSSALSSPSLYLSPGQSGSITMSVTSPGSATAGTYGVTVSTSDTAVTNHTANTTVNYNVLSPCTPASPSVSLAPASQTGFAGSALSYTVTLANRDSAGCESSTFSFSRTVPNGWGGTFGQPSLSLSPGQSGTTTLSVGSPLTALSGSYDLTVTASAGGDSSRTASGNGTYSVQVPVDTQAPTAPSGLTATLKRTQVQLAWLASKDNIGVVKYSVWRNGVLIANSIGTGYLDTPPAGSTTVTYVVRALDAAGNTSATSNSAILTLGSTKGRK